MSHIRPKEFTTSTCSTCRREGYTREVSRSLLTAAEYAETMGEKIEHIKGAPPAFETMYARCGATIYAAVAEAKEYCIKYGVPGVVFEFNGKTVLITGMSDADAVSRSWWQQVYKETPEEAFARR